MLSTATLSTNMTWSQASDQLVKNENGWHFFFFGLTKHFWSVEKNFFVLNVQEATHILILSSFIALRPRSGDRAKHKHNSN